MILEGTTSSGAVVPVQVTDEGRVVAEGLTGPEGPQGPEGPEGPPGPAGDGWQRNGTVLSPANAGDSITTTGDVSGADITATGTLSNAATSFDPGTTGIPFVRANDGNVGIGNSTPASLLQVGHHLGPDGRIQVSAANGNDPNEHEFFKFNQAGNANAISLSTHREVSGGRWINDFRLGLGTSATGGPVTRLVINPSGIFQLGDGSNNGVSLNPGSTGVPLVRDSVGRLLVGINSAPSGTLAGDVVCQGAVVLQSPNGTWFALEVEDNGTLSISQTVVR